MTTTEPTADGDHGGIETRAATVVPAIDWLADHRWPGLDAIGRLVRCRATDGKTTTETASCPRSAAPSPERLNGVARSHRGIENGLDRRRDLLVSEDQDRTRCDDGRDNTACSARMALNAMQEDSAGSLAANSSCAVRDDAF